jgi:hypothetical protein
MRLIAIFALAIVCLSNIAVPEPGLETRYEALFVQNDSLINAE